MIDVKPIKSYILVQKIKEHNQIKDDLLCMMDKMPDKKTTTDFESIKKTDYYLPKEHTRDYGDLFLKTIQPYNDNIKNFYNAEEHWIINYWFQQYLFYPKPFYLRYINHVIITNTLLDFSCENIFLFAIQDM